MAPLALHWVQRQTHSGNLSLVRDIPAVSKKKKKEKRKRKRKKKVLLFWWHSRTISAILSKAVPICPYIKFYSWLKSYFLNFERTIVFFLLLSNKNVPHPCPSNPKTLQFIFSETSKMLWFLFFFQNICLGELEKISFHGRFYFLRLLI